MCFNFLYNFVWTIYFSKKKWVRCDNMCIFVHLQYILVYPILKKIEFSSQIFEKP